MPAARREPETRESRPNTGREERSGGYTPGKNSSDLNTPSGLKAPAPSHPQQAGHPASTQAPSNQSSEQQSARRS